jgi:hypothetical protein
MDNVIVVFLFHKRPDAKAIKRSILISLFISLVNGGSSILLSRYIKCRTCPSFTPQTSVVPVYGVWAVIYFVVMVDRWFGPWLTRSSRPMLIVFVNFLFVDYLLLASGLALVLFKVDVGFCVMASSLVVYSILYAPLLSFVFNKDSKWVTEHLDLHGELVDPLIGPDDAAALGAGGACGGAGAGGGASAVDLEAEFRKSLRKLMAKTPSVNWIDFSELEISRSKRIGVGAYGEVYAGSWHGTPVAVKTLFAFQGTKDGAARAALEEFGKEIAVMSHLRHPNVILFLGACFDSEHHCIVTEYMPQGNVFAMLGNATQSSLPWQKRLKIARDAALGMAYLHSFKPPVIHRDLKTQNLLVDNAWRVKVADFGLSRVLQDDKMSRIGTPQWAAPEVIREEVYTEAADVYGYGIILWELAALQCPYKGMNAIRIARSVAFEGLRPSLDAVPAACPREILVLMQECWDADPQKRPTFPQILERLAKINY